MRSIGTSALYREGSTSHREGSLIECLASTNFGSRQRTIRRTIQRLNLLIGLKCFYVSSEFYWPPWYAVCSDDDG